MLAIVIPYYKLAFFEATLDSLAAQTDKRFKVYIGDDASLEDPIVLLEKYKEQFDFVYHRFDENLGETALTKQWERCIALSGEEEWLMILGDDDVFGKNVVEEFYKQYDVFVEKSNVVRFATVSQNYIEYEVSKVYTHPNWENASESYFRRFKGLTRSSLSEYVFKRSVYTKYKFFNYSLGWHSDDWAWLEFSEKKLIYTINESVVSIGFSKISLSGMDHNFGMKNLATIHFYRNIIKKKLYLFSKEQALELLMEYEILVKKNRKLTFDEWLLLIEQYILNFKLVSFLKLFRRIILSNLK